MVDLVEVEARRERGSPAALWLDFAAGEVAEAEPLTALRAELWLVVLRDRGELQVDLLPAEAIAFTEEADELSHVDGRLLA